VNHAGDSHLENSNEGQSKLMECLLIILLVGGLKAIETALAYIIQHKEVTTRHTAFQALTYKKNLATKKRNEA
jgi:hypothetical protein